MTNGNYQDSQVMEKDILSEENLPQTAQQPPQIKHKLAIKPSVKISLILSKMKNFKKPKLKTIIILLVAIFVVLLGLLLLSSRQSKEETKTRVKIAIASPQVSADPQFEQTKKEVFNFNNELDSLDSELNNIKFPEIDLDVDF